VRAVHAWIGAAAMGASVLAASSAYLTTVAEASPAGPAFIAQRPPGKPPPRLNGNIDAGMPAAAISATDGLPPVLVNGRSYRLTVHVGVAAGQPNTDAELLINGVVNSVCLTQPVPSGAISTLHCSFVASAASVASAAVGRTGLQIKVLVGAAHGGQVVATFDHVVVRTASPE
jgi:hypothetical protein